MKYCKDTTLNHHLAIHYPLALELLKNIFLTEGGKMDFSNEERALNLDKIEEIRCSGKSSKNPTMDLVIGISDFGKNKQMLLVELKLRIKRPSNIKKEEIEEKIKHSIDNLLLHNPVICKEKILLFNREVAPAAKSYFKRMFENSKYLQIKVMSEQAFKTEYF